MFEAKEEKELTWKEVLLLLGLRRSVAEGVDLKVRCRLGGAEIGLELEFLLVRESLLMMRLI